MGKRYRDTVLWDKEWYVALSCVDRCALDYILCRCDAVGVWAPAFTVAERLIGETVDWGGLPERVNGNIRILENGKWWLVDFCRYQYGVIRADSNSKVQQSFHRLLVQHGLWEEYQQTVAPTLSHRVQEKEKEKVKEKEEEKIAYAEDVLLTASEYAKLVTRAGERTATAAIEKLSAAKGAKGYKYKSDYKAILTWVLGSLVGQRAGGGPVPAPKIEHPACPDCGKPTTSRRSGAEHSGWYIYVCGCGGRVEAA